MSDELTWEEANPEPDEPENLVLPSASPWVKSPIGRITPHFCFSEAVCDHCGLVPSVAAVRNTARWLERIRSEVFDDRPMAITSWCRCNVHNAAVGGVPGSTHTLGWAVDFSVVGLTVEQTQTLLLRHQGEGKLIGGLGIYRTFSHIDRGRPRRWRVP